LFVARCVSVAAEWCPTGGALGARSAWSGPTYPAAMKCLLADREGLTVYLRFPAEHHHRIRHSNFIERTFGETRRRTKVIGRLPARPAA